MPIKLVSLLILTKKKITAKYVILHRFSESINTLVLKLPMLRTPFM